MKNLQSSHKKLKEFSNNFYKNSQSSQRILTKFLQKLKKFKEFLKNSLNFPQNFQTLFTNSRKIPKHFSQKICKIFKQLSQNESKFPAKVCLKKLTQSTKLAHKKLTQKPTARAARHTAGWCLPAPSRKSHFGLKCCILRNSRFPQQNPHLL